MRTRQSEPEHKPLTKPLSHPITIKVYLKDHATMQKISKRSGATVSFISRLAVSAGLQEVAKAMSRLPAAEGMS